jgi:HEAT repeat protein
MLSDSDSDVRQAAAAALGDMRNPAALPGLMMAVGDEDRLVRTAAQHALELIDPGWPKSPSAQEAVPRLKALLAVRPAWVRSAILQVLKQIEG